MSILSNETIIAAPADAVWHVVGAQFDRIGDWATAIPASAAAPASPTLAAISIDIDAPVAGRVCQTGLRLVPQVTETVVRYDQAGRALTYQATGLPAFVAAAQNTWHVTPLDEGRSRVRFEARLETRGLLGRLFRWWLLSRVGRNGRHLLDDLRHYVEHGTPSPRKQRRLRAGDRSRVGRS